MTDRFLRARDVRQAIVEHGLMMGRPRRETNELLFELGLPPIGTPKPIVLAPSKVEVSVYVIAHDHPGVWPVKVGFSRQPEVRLKALEFQYRANLYLAKVTRPYSRSEARQIERDAHEVLARWALGREWFNCTIDHAWDAVLESNGEPWLEEAI